MGISSKKSTQRSKNQSTEDVVQTPINPPWVTSAMQGYTQRVANQFANSGADSLRQAASPLQDSTSTAAQGLLSGPSSGYADARQMGMQAANAPAVSTVSPGAATPQLGAAAQYGGTNVGAAAQYGGADIGAAAQMQAANTGNAAQYAGANVGNAAQMQAAGIANAAQYGGTNVGAAAQYGGANVGNAAQMTADQLGNRNIAQYANPFNQSVVDTTLADFDEQAGATRARQAREAARTGAFGGSRYGIAQGQTEGELARARATTQSRLLSDSHDRAMRYAEADTGRGQAAGLANQAATNQASLAQAGYSQQAGLANQAATNQASLAQAGFTQQAGLANRAAIDKRATERAGLLQQAGLANQAATNQAALAQAGYTQQAGLANRAATDKLALANSGYEQAASLANRDAVDRRAESRAGFTQQAGLANQAAQNKAALAQAGFTQQAGLANRAATDKRASERATLDESTGQFNAGLLADANQFNARAENDRLSRQMSAAGLMSGIAKDQTADQRAAVDMANTVGNQRYDLDYRNLMAPYSHLDLYGNALGRGQYGLFQGMNNKGRTSQQGLTTTKTSPSLFRTVFGGFSPFRS